MHAVAGVAAQVPAEIEGRGQNGDVRLAPVRGDDQRARLETEARLPQRLDAERCVRVRPHAAGDGVVEVEHAYILACMASLRLGDPAPAFELPDLDGGTVSLSDYAGKPFAVVFSCCHCPYVIAWEDRLNEVARDYDGRAGFVAINSNSGYLGDSPDDMRQRVDEKGFVFPFL